MPNFSFLATCLVSVSNVPSRSSHDLAIGVPSEAAPVLILQAFLSAGGVLDVIEFLEAALTSLSVVSVCNV